MFMGFSVIAADTLAETAAVHKPRLLPDTSIENAP